MAAFSGPDVIDSGLVLALDAADRNSYPGSGTTWTDLSGNSNTGTLTNGPTYSSSNGGSIVFDGSNDYILGPTSSDFVFGTGNYTISYWVYGNSFSNTPTIFDLRQNVLGSAYSDYILASDNKFRLWLNGTSLYNGGITTLQTQNWYNICVTRSGSNGNVYINAILDGTFTNSSNLNEGQLRLATNINQSTSFLNGRISNVLVYRGRALTATEVQQNFNATRSRYGI
jgi:hypothetical protein